MRKIPQTHIETVQANGIRIAYDIFGNPEDPPLLLIAGIGQQLVAWEEDFCGELASRGYRVIRFDNRDMGQTTWFDEAGLPDMRALVQTLTGGDAAPMDAPYGLADMARDAVGLLDALGIAWRIK